jgi:hypothetical protein
VKIWYATFDHGERVILLHGGLANADYWGNQVRAFQNGYRAPTRMDRRDRRQPRRVTKLPSVEHGPINDETYSVSQQNLRSGRIPPCWNGSFD